MNLETHPGRIEECPGAARQLVEKVAGYPSTGVETTICLSVGVLTCLVVMAVVARALRAGKVTKLRAVLATTATVVSALAGWAFFAVYILPLTGKWSLPEWSPVVGTVLVLLLIAVPVVRVVFEMNYLTALVCVFLGVAAATGSVTLVGAALKSLRVGTSQFLKSQGGAGRGRLLPEQIGEK